MTVHNHGPEEGPGVGCREHVIGGCLTGRLVTVQDTEQVIEQGHYATVQASGAAEPFLAAVGVAAGSSDVIIVVPFDDPKVAEGVASEIAALGAKVAPRAAEGGVH